MPAIEPSLSVLRNPVLRYLLATRPAFLTVTLYAVLIGLAAAWFDGVPLNSLTATVTLIFALVAHAGVNVFNDYYDALNGTDELNSGRLYPFTGGSRFIQNGVLSPAAVAGFGITLFGATVIAGLWLGAHSGHMLYAIGLAGLVIGWTYSAPPLKLNSRGLGEFCVAAGFALVTVGTDFVQRGTIAATAAVAAVSYSLLVTNLLYINQFPDRIADAAAGKRHWVVRLAPERARWGYVWIALGAHAWLVGAVWAGILPWPTLVALAALFPATSAARSLLRYASQPQLLTAAIRATIAAATVHGLLLAGGLAAARIFIVR